MHLSARQFWKAVSPSKHGRCLARDHTQGGAGLSDGEDVAPSIAESILRENVDTHTQVGRRDCIIRLHAIGAMAYWAMAGIIADADTAGDWVSEGYVKPYDWYCDLVEHNGFERPSQSEYFSFQRQMGNGHLLRRCDVIGINPQVLASIGPSKAYEVWKRAGRGTPEEISSGIEKASVMTREDLIRSYTVALPEHTAPATAPENEGGPKSEAAPKVGTTLNPAIEPGPPSPIPDDTRPYSETVITCSCGRVHTILGTVLSHAVTGGANV